MYVSRSAYGSCSCWHNIIGSAIFCKDCLPRASCSIRKIPLAFSRCNRHQYLIRRKAFQRKSGSWVIFSLRQSANWWRSQWSWIYGFWGFVRPGFLPTWFLWPMLRHCRWCKRNGRCPRLLRDPFQADSILGMPFPSYSFQPWPTESGQNGFSFCQIFSP